MPPHRRRRGDRRSPRTVEERLGRLDDDYRQLDKEMIAVKARLNLLILIVIASGILQTWHG